MLAAIALVLYIQYDRLDVAVASVLKSCQSFHARNMRGIKSDTSHNFFLDPILLLVVATITLNTSIPLLEETLCCFESWGSNISLQTGPERKRSFLKVTLKRTKL